MESEDTVRKCWSPGFDRTSRVTQRPDEGKHSGLSLSASASGSRLRCEDIVEFDDPLSRFYSLLTPFHTMAYVF